MAVVNLDLHDGQLEIFEATQKVVTAVMGRRFGKTRLGLTKIPIMALSFPGEVDPISPEVVLVAMPTLQQAIPIIWEPLKALAEGPFSPWVLKIDNQRHQITFKHGKPQIRVVGANDQNGDRLRGNRIWFFWGDEFQDFKPEVLDTVIMPAMADTPGSTALLTGTPKGKLNHLYEVFNRGTLDPETYASFNMPTYTNPFVPNEEIEKLRITLPPRLFRQEMEASFEEFPGKVHYELGSGNLAPGYPTVFDLTILGVDFGDVHPSFSVLGRADGSWYWLEGWEPTEGVPVPQPTQDANIVRLAQKYNVQGCYCDPSRPSGILGIRALGKEYGLPGLSRAIAGFNRIEEGISQVHSLIYQCLLMFRQETSEDEKTRRVTPGYVSPYDAYQLHNAYHRATDRNGNVTEAIEDGQRDHTVDSTRYALAQSVSS